MKLIVGLGNPGAKYENTRHNIGFEFLKTYCKLKNCFDFKAGFKGEYASFIQNGEKVILFKPLTYMNLSGEAIKDIVTYYNINLDDILVIYDDKDIPFAALRLRVKGNPGSHNGLKNITMLLNDTNFKRIRVGIGRPENNKDMIDFVLSKFNQEETQKLQETFKDIAACCDLFIDNNFEMAMNRYNFHKSDETSN